MNAIGSRPVPDLLIAGEPILDTVTHDFDLMRMRIVDAQQLEKRLKAEHVAALQELNNARNMMRQYLEAKGVV